MTTDRKRPTSTPLNSREQKLEWRLFALVIFFVLIIIIGVLQPSIGIEWDRLLVPSFFLTAGLFFWLLGFNALAKGLLVEKWTPFVLFAWIKAITKLWVNDRGSRNDAWKTTLGLLSVLVGSVCIITALYDWYKHF